MTGLGSQHPVTARLRFALWQHGDTQCKRNPGGWANNNWSSAPSPSGHANINLNNGNVNDNSDSNNNNAAYQVL